MLCSERITWKAREIRRSAEGSVTAFADTPEERQRLDWQLLRNGAVALYSSARVLDEDVAWLGSHGYRVVKFRANEWTTGEDMHSALASALKFPDHYGRNLDALNDVLGDVEVRDEGGLALAVTRFDDFAVHHQQLAWHLLDLLAEHSRIFALTGRRFLVICQSDDPTLAVGPFGARGLAWNPRESFEHRFPRPSLGGRAKRICEAMLDGSMDVLAGVRAMSALRHEPGGESVVAQIWAGLGSETESFPTPDKYPLWEATALRAQLNGLERYRTAILEAAKEHLSVCAHQPSSS